MKIKKIQAKSTREAMTLVREMFGNNGVILTNKATSSGVELVVADEFPVQAEQNVNHGGNVDKHHDNNDLLAESSIIALESPSETALRDLQGEFKSLKSLIQEQLSDLIWENKKRRQPVESMILRKLIHFGFSAEISARLVKGLGCKVTEQQAWATIEERLVNALPVVDDNLIKRGVLALIGTSGAGKTATIAKLASQYALKYGAQHVALVSLDTKKIGANETLKIYANILDIPIRVVDDMKGVQDALNDFRKKQLVLIDTPGVSPSNKSELASLADYFPKDVTIKKLLVVAANNQISFVNDVIQQHRLFDVVGTVLTKTDENVILGGVLSAMITAQIPICYVCDGQQVPDDIKHFASSNLITTALVRNTSNEQEVDEESIARIFSMERVEGNYAER